MRSTLTIILTGLLMSSLFGCDTMNKQDVGMVTGGVAGGLLGSTIGQGTGQLVAIAAGTLAGAMIGGAIGSNMDKTDQLQAQQALEHTQTGQATTWRNPDTGNQYTVVPRKTYVRHKQPCREYQMTAFIGGKTQKVYGRACRQADGSWKVQG